MSYQLIKEPIWLALKIWALGDNEKKSNTGGKGSHPYDLHAWQKQSENQPQLFFLIS